MSSDHREAGPERLPAIPAEAMSPEQRRVADAIAGGPRGGLRGPFNAWLRSPELADLFQKAGEKIRYRSALPAALNEMAILITARSWTSQFEWYAHRELAARAGLSMRIADALAAGKRPDGMSAAEDAVYGFCTELHRDRFVSDRSYAAARTQFGEEGIVDLIGACGYYTLVSMTLNVARVPIPHDATPLPPLAAAWPD